MTMTMETEHDILSHEHEVKEKESHLDDADNLVSHSIPPSLNGGGPYNAAAEEPASPNEELSGDDEDYDDSDSESEQEDGAEEAMPDGDSNADLHALLAFSKSRLQKAQPEPHAEADDEPAEVTDDEEDSVKGEINDDGGDAANTLDGASPEGTMQDTPKSDRTPNSINSESETAGDKSEKGLPAAVTSDQDLMKIAEDKLRIAEKKAELDDARAENDPAYLLRLAEKKVKEAEEKAKKDEELTGTTVLKPKAAINRRSDENAELWALLNYSKMRLETGSTPQIGKRSSGVRDDMSVSSKISQTSKKSMSSKKSVASRASGARTPVSMVGPSENGNVEVKTGEGRTGSEIEADVPFPDVTSGEASVDGSVGSGTRSSVEADNESIGTEESENDEEESDEEEEEEEDELPDFLKSDDSEEVDPEETRRRLEEARTFGASILGLADEKLTDVQMLQAIAVAEEAARNGDEKFTTKSSISRLREAKMEDLKALLDFGSKSTGDNKGEREAVGWGIGRGRFVKKIGAVFQDFKERCDAIDEKKRQERHGKPTNSEILSAALLDLKRQIDEYDKKRRDTQESE